MVKHHEPWAAPNACLSVCDPCDEAATPRRVNRLVIIHTALILAFMLALDRGWTDFAPIPYDCFYPPYFFISGPIVYGVAHYAQHRVDPFISVDDIGAIRLVWNRIPGTVCLILGGIQWWLIELAYVNLRRQTMVRTVNSGLYGASARSSHADEMI